MKTTLSSRELDGRWGRLLLDIVEETRGLVCSRASRAEREAELRVLVLRWRCLAQIAGQDLASVDPRFRKAWGVLRDAVRTLGRLRLPGLDPQAREDWIGQLAQGGEDLQRLRLETRERRERSRVAAVLFDDLRSIPARYLIPEDPEGVRLLREGVEALAPFLPLREELARFALPYRAALGDGFDFLWPRKRAEGPDEKREGTRAVHLSRREVLSRMLGRMISKTAIGGIHAPVGLILRGFPAHQYGLAKEALEVACQAGLIQRKGTNYGERVYLEASLVARAQAFVDGEESGLPAIDRWVAEERGRGAA